MASDLDIAQVVYNLYWDTSKIDQIIDPDGVCVGIKHFTEATVICFRGSTTFLDWVRDFEDFAQMVDDPDLGGVHPGFIEGMHDVLDQVRPDSQKLTIITGHSLGAARAWVYAALVAKHDTVMSGDRIPAPAPQARHIAFVETGDPKAETQPCQHILMPGGIALGSLNIVLDILDLPQIIFAHAQLIGRFQKPIPSINGSNRPIQSITQPDFQIVDGGQKGFGKLDIPLITGKGHV